MSSSPEMPVADRIVQVLDDLGIVSANFAGGGESEYRALVAAYPGRVASSTVVGIANPEAFRMVESRLMTITGDSGPVARLAQTMLGLKAARHVKLRSYEHAFWSDVVKDRSDEVEAALLSFLARADEQNTVSPTIPPGEGEIAGIRYRAMGLGPPLVLFPIGLAASQWEPLLSALKAKYCTVVLGGPLLGYAAILENRGQVSGYLRMFSGLVDIMKVTPGERILDVGCGTGVLDRWLVGRTSGANPVVAIDNNSYLLNEAIALARKEGHESAIEFREADAEALPFSESSFDVAISVTTLEEGNAERMLAEMIRVVRPGGRVGVIVRGDVDLPFWVNLALTPELKAKVEQPGTGAGKTEGGVADAGLYKLFAASSFEAVEMFPQLVTMQTGRPLENIETNRRARLTQEEQAEWRAARDTAGREGTFMIAQPYHCAVGTKI